MREVMRDGSSLVARTCLCLIPFGVAVFLFSVFGGGANPNWFMVSSFIAPLVFAGAGCCCLVSGFVLCVADSGATAPDRHNELDTRLDAVVFAARQSNVRMAQLQPDSLLRSAIARSAEASYAAEAAASLAAGGSSSEISGGVGVIADWRPAH